MKQFRRLLLLLLLAPSVSYGQSQEYMLRLPEPDSSLVDPVELARVGHDCYRFLDSLGSAISFSENCLWDPTPIFSHWDRLRLREGWGMCLRPVMRQGMGDRTRLLFYRQKDREAHPEMFDPVHHPDHFFQNSPSDYITSDGSPEAAWQIFLMMNASYVMPHYWHCINEERTYIFAPEDLLEGKLSCDISDETLDQWRQAKGLDRLRPSVVRKGDGYVVRCVLQDHYHGILCQRMFIQFTPDFLWVEELDNELLYDDPCISLF